MRLFLIVLVCIVSSCQAGKIPQGNDVIINSSVEPIPDITTISPVHTTVTGYTTTTNKTTPTTISTSTATPTTTTTTTKPSTTSSTTPSSTTPTTKITTKEPTQSTTSAKTTTSTAKPTISTTVQPIISTTSKPASPNRGFDGPSFIGGIVLASGLMAIGFVAFKFYRARTELNYHTL